MKNNDAQVLKPLDHVFESTHVIGSSILGNGQKFNIFERVEYPQTGGIYVHYRGLPYPKKGFPYPEAVWMNDIVKKNIVMLIDIVGRKTMVLPIIGFILTPWKFKKQVIDSAIQRFASISQWLMSSHQLKEERHSPAAREVLIFVRTFAENLNLKNGNMLARVVASIIEYDDAYRLRLEDILSETDSAKLIKNPSGEIMRLGMILDEREGSHAKNTFKKFSMILYCILLVPKIRNAFRKTMKAINFANLQLDEADRYHVLLRDDYKFFGETFEQRLERYKEFHKDGNYPPMVEIKS